MKMKKLYVTYGSNLNMDQMKFRCPESKVYGVGTLEDFELLFKGSPNNAHATVEKKKGSSVPVLVWSISQNDELSLDRYEGFPRYYIKKTVTVNMNDHKVRAMVYIMNKGFYTNRPSDAYVETIRQGYLDCGFDLSILREMVDYNHYEMTQLLPIVKQIRR